MRYNTDNNRPLTGELERLAKNYPHSEQDIERWMTEDDTAIYDRIVAGRRRKRIAAWVAAAASVAILIGVWPLFLHDTTEQKVPMMAEVIAQEEISTPQIEAQNEPAMPTVMEVDTKVTPATTPMRNPKETITEETTIQTTPTPAKHNEEQAETVPTLSTTSTDDMLASLEEEMDAIRDSVYIAHAANTLREDKELQEMLDKRAICNL